MNEMQVRKCDRKWNPPMSGKLKLIVDVVFKNRIASFGFILWDDVGALKMAGVGPLGLLSSAGHVELMGIWRSLELVVQNYVVGIVIEPCQVVIRQLCCFMKNMTSLGAIVKGLQERFEVYLLIVIFPFVHLVPHMFK